MNNKSNISNVISRVKFFYSFHRTSILYKILKFLWCIVFTPLLITESIAEFIIMTIIYTLGTIFGSLGLIGLIPAFLIGVLNALFKIIFYVLFAFCNFVDYKYLEEIGV